MTAEKKPCVCDLCTKTVASARSPRGWHRTPDKRLLCGDCWAKSYRARCIRLPVAGPYNPSGEAQPEQWAALRTAVIAAWDSATRLANWTVTEILRNEPAQTPGQRLPALETYLYGAFGAAPFRGEWAGAAGSANAVMRFVEQSYKAKRGQIQALHSATAPTYRWPYPYPVPKQAWSARVEQEHVIVSIPLGGERVELRIRNDPTSRYYLRQMVDIIEGRASGGELKLIGQHVQPNDRRNGIAFRRPGGGESRWVRLTIMVSGYFPATEPRVGIAGTMRVTTGANSLLYAECDGDSEPWVVHGDHIREWVVASRAMRQRWSDDTKAETRRPNRIKNRRRDAAERHNGKYQRRLHSACEEVSAWVVNYARRRRVASILYDDSCVEFAPGFAYGNLRLLLERKSAENGIEIISSGTVATNSPDPLETETQSA